MDLEGSGCIIKVTFKNLTGRNGKSYQKSQSGLTRFEKNTSSTMSRAFRYTDFHDEGKKTIWSPGLIFRNNIKMNHK